MCTIEDLLEWFSEEDQLLAASEPISCQPQRLQKQLAEQKVLWNRRFYVHLFAQLL